MHVKRLVPILAVLALTLRVQAFAAPAINNISGKFTDGSSITVSGSSFGVNGPTTVIFDNFDKGTNGSVIKTGPGSANVGKWDDIGGGDDNNPPVYSNSYHVSGSLALRGDYRVKTSSGTDSSSNANVQNLNFTEAFLSYWFFLPTNSEFPGSSDDNWKLGWFVYSPGGDEDLLVFEMLGPSGEKDVGCNNCYVYGDWPNRSDHVVLQPDFTFRKGDWYRVHMYIKGTYDYTGKRQLWTLSPDASMKVSQRVNWTGRQWNENGNYWNQFIINPWARLCDGCSESYGFFDDVYLATGPYARARVEIGNASSYSSCTNLSICTVDSWSSTSIQATFRQGSFGPGGAYLYITDANGVTSNGYQLAIGEGSSGNNYYVSKDGSDSNPGTSGAPFLTIGKATSVAEAGDTIHVGAGTYSEKVSFTRSGTPGNKITLIASANREAVINGGVNINKDYIRIEGFKITSSVNRQNGVDVNGDYAEVVDNYIWNVRGRAIMGNQSGKPRGAYIADNHIYHCQMGIMVYGTDWLISGNEVERMYMYGASDDCDYARIFGDGNTFVGNFFHGNQVNEIGSAHVDCFQTWCEGPNSVYWATNSVIDGNICFDFHQAFMIEAGNCGDKVSHYTITNNIFAHTFNTSLGGYGINNEGVDHVTVTNNTFADLNYGGADMYAGNDSAEYAVVKNNIFYNCGRGYSFSSPSTSTGDYNLIYGASDPSPSAPHNIIGVDPRFVDPSNDNYRLQEGSPACGAGEGGSDMGAVPCDGTPPVTACSDGIDNDGDALIDYPSDPGCSSAMDGDEYNEPPPVYACSDGIDNDGDALIDYPNDPGCISATDGDEYNEPPPVYACSDGIDNDGDALIDYPSDPGCSSATDGDEYNEPPIEEGVVEAEIGLLTAPMTKVFDDACSGGAYIHTPSSGSGTVVYTVKVELGGIYKIVARVFSIDEGHDSFFVQIDGEEEDIWDLNPSDSPGEHNIWREDEVTKRGSGTYNIPEFDPYTFKLTRGVHTISFRGRESNAKLDYFRLEEISGIVPPKVPAGFTITGE